MSERNWLIEQYLTARLPDDLHQRVDERRRADPEFDQYVLTQWLISNKFGLEQDTILFDQSMAHLLNELNHEKKAKPSIVTTKKTPFLIKLLTAGLAAAIVTVLLMWSIRPPVPQISQLPVNDPNYGASNSAITIVQYTHAPGFLGRWQLQDQYRWPKDTLFLYGKTLGQPLPVARLDPINESDQYHLVVGKRTYLIHVGQEAIIPVTADERP